MRENTLRREEPGCGFLKPLAVLLPPNFGVLQNSMFIYALGKNIFSFNSKHCFARQEVIRKPFIYNCYKDFWKQKTLIYEKQNCVYLEDGGGVNKP